MQHVTAQGTLIPKLGYGTWQLTGQECRDGVAHALAVGYRHIDTAQMYGNEDLVGQAMTASSVPRDEVFLTTKLLPRNMASDLVPTSVKQSLTDLETDYVDLLLIHWPSREVPLRDTLEAMLELRDQGYVRGVGVSNFPPSMVRQALEHAPILANQVEYHPYLSQDELLALAREHDHMLTAYSPLANGTLLGEPVLGEIAEAHGATAAQVAIAWLLAQDKVATIPKATAPERIESNFAAVELRLSDDELARVTALDQGNAGRVIDPSIAPDWER